VGKRFFFGGTSAENVFIAENENFFFRRNVGKRFIFFKNFFKKYFGGTQAANQQNQLARKNIFGGTWKVQGVDPTLKKMKTQLK